MSHQSLEKASVALNVVNCRQDEGRRGGRFCARDIRTGIICRRRRRNDIASDRAFKIGLNITRIQDHKFDEVE